MFLIVFSFLVPSRIWTFKWSSAWSVSASLTNMKSLFDASFIPPFTVSLYLMLRFSLQKSNISWALLITLWPLTIALWHAFFYDSTQSVWNGISVACLKKSFLCFCVLQVDIRKTCPAFKLGSTPIWPLWDSLKRFCCLQDCDGLVFKLSDLGRIMFEVITDSNDSMLDIFHA